MVRSLSLSTTFSTCPSLSPSLSLCPFLSLSLSLSLSPSLSLSIFLSSSAPSPHLRYLSLFLDLPLFVSFAAPFFLPLVASSPRDVLYFYTITPFIPSWPRLFRSFLHNIQLPSFPSFSTDFDCFSTHLTNPNPDPSPNPNPNHDPNPNSLYTQCYIHNPASFLAFPLIVFLFFSRFCSGTGHIFLDIPLRCVSYCQDDRRGNNIMAFIAKETPTSPKCCYAFKSYNQANEVCV